MKKILLLFLTGAWALISCQKTETQKGFRVALVLDKGGIDDKSFNASAYRGVTRAKEELGVYAREVEATDDGQIEPTLKNFAEKKFDLVIAVGFAQKEAVERAAKAYPNIHFALVDAVVDLPNVVSLMFKEHEGSFLAGALAALKSKRGVIGFVGGMDIPLIRRFEYAYRQGATHVRKNIKILVNYVGVTGEAWNNPTKAKELALAQISQKADIIFHAAGASGTGIFDAVEEQSQKQSRTEQSQTDRSTLFAIGVDSNQNWMKPGRILTSMLKRVDVAVYETIKATQMGEFRRGRQDFGLQNLGIDLAIDEHNQNLIEESLLKEIDRLRGDILQSRLAVVDYYQLKK